MIEVIGADNLEWMRGQPADSVDLVLTSPPYEAARTYGVGFKLKGQEFVDWCVERYLECVRLSRGLVAWVIEGQTRQFRWSAAPVLLMADLHRAGVKLRKPPIFHRVGIPGSGGPDWLRNDYEFIVCSSKGKLPWSDNTAMGHPPKYAPGGEMSHRSVNGTRVNQWGGSYPKDSQSNSRKPDGSRDKKFRPSHRVAKTVNCCNRQGSGTRATDGDEVQSYQPPATANPGNVISCIVGGGVMGSRLANLNEAPYPESLCEFFIRSFCPPGGTVLDPHCGSGTTLAVAKRTGRNAIGIDIRASQVELTKRRLKTVQPELIM